MYESIVFSYGVIQTECYFAGGSHIKMRRKHLVSSPVERTYKMRMGAAHQLGLVSACWHNRTLHRPAQARSNCRLTLQIDLLSGKRSTFSTSSFWINTRSKVKEFRNVYDNDTNIFKYSKNSFQPQIIVPLQLVIKKSVGTMKIF